MSNILRHQPKMNKLADNAYPMFVALLTTNAIDRQLVMGQLANSLVIRSAQNLHDITHTKALINTVDSRQRFARIHESVVLFWRVETDVAVTTRLLTPLAKIVQQHQTTTGLRLGKRPHRIELMPFDIQQLPGRFLFEATAQPCHISRIVKQHCFRRQAVTPGAAGFLVIGLDVARNIEMHHEAYVGFVDSHAKRHGRYDDLQVITLEFLLHFCTYSVFQPGMISPGANASALQTRGGIFYFSATVTVDNTGLTALLLHVAHQLIERLKLLHQHVANVRAVKAADLN